MAVSDAEERLDAYGLKMDPEMEERFNEYRKTHNQVCSMPIPRNAYRALGSLLTGPPDAWTGALSGTTRVALRRGFPRKCAEGSDTSMVPPEDVIRLREEMTEQIRALGGHEGMVPGMVTTLAGRVQRPGSCAVAVLRVLGRGENNGAAMSLGRNTAFLDIYLGAICGGASLMSRPPRSSWIAVIKCVWYGTCVRLNTMSFGRSTWVTEAIGGMGEDGRPLVPRLPTASCIP